MSARTWGAVLAVVAFAGERIGSSGLRFELGAAFSARGLPAESLRQLLTSTATMSAALPVFVGLVAIVAPRAPLALGGAVLGSLGLTLAALGPPASLVPGVWLAVLGSCVLKAVALVLGAEFLLRPSQKLAVVLTGGGAANLGVLVASLVPAGSADEVPFRAGLAGYTLAALAALGALRLARRCASSDAGASAGAAAGILALGGPVCLSMWVISQTMGMSAVLSEAPLWLLSVNLWVVIGLSTITAMAVLAMPARLLRGAAATGLAIGVLMVLAGVVGLWLDAPQSVGEALASQVGGGLAEVALYGLVASLFVSRCPPRLAVLGLALFSAAMSTSGPLASLPSVLTKLVASGLGLLGAICVGALLGVRGLLSHLEGADTTPSPVTPR